MTPTIGWRVNAERLVLFGWSRAVLLQLAHPLIAAGVHEHSTFRAGPIAAARRLHQTVHSMLALTFGDAQARQATLARIRGIHRRVHGVLDAPLGPFATGTPYSADAPDLLLWVHATLLDSLPLAYEQLIGPLTASDRDAYCAEAARVAIALGANQADVPTNWQALERYLAQMHASGTLCVGADALELRDAVLSPSFAPLVGPFASINRRLTIEWLPPAIRRQYAFATTDTGHRRAEQIARSVRRVRSVLPRQIAWWRDARRRPVK